MTRKKHPKSKKSVIPGVFTSSLLGGGEKGERKDKANVVKNPQTENKINETSLSTCTAKDLVNPYENIILSRAVVELAIVYLVKGCLVDNKGSVMAPPIKDHSGGASSTSGLSRLMGPVQDLGRSLLGFLIGSPQHIDSHANRNSASNNVKRESIVSVASPGRQRPHGHPAIPPTPSSTPMLIRRVNKPDKTPSVSNSMSSKKEGTLKDHPESEHPALIVVPSKQEGSVKDHPGNELTTPTIMTPPPEVRPPSSHRRRRKNKKGIQSVKEHETKGCSKVSQYNQPPEKSSNQSELGKEKDNNAEPEHLKHKSNKILQSYENNGVEVKDSKSLCGIEDSNTGSQHLEENTNNDNQFCETYVDKDKDSNLRSQHIKDEVNQNEQSYETNGDKDSKASEQSLLCRTKDSNTESLKDHENKNELSCETNLVEDKEKKTLGPLSGNEDSNTGSHYLKDNCETVLCDDDRCKYDNSNRVLTELISTKLDLRDKSEKEQINDLNSPSGDGYVTARSSVFLSDFAVNPNDVVNIESESAVPEITGSLNPTFNHCHETTDNNTDHLKDRSGSKLISEIKYEILETCINDVDNLVLSDNCVNPATHNFVNPASLLNCSFPAVSASHKESAGVTTPISSSPSKEQLNSSIPPPPPLPPVGFLTSGLKSQLSENDLLDHTDAVNAKHNGTLKKSKTIGREQALLTQLSGIDDTFAAFLRANIKDPQLVGNLSKPSQNKPAERSEQNIIENSPIQEQVTDTQKEHSGSIGQTYVNAQQDHIESSTTDRTVQETDKNVAQNNSSFNTPVNVNDNELDNNSGSCDNEIATITPLSRSRVNSNACSEFRKRKVSTTIPEVKRRSVITPCGTDRERPKSYLDLSESLLGQSDKCKHATESENNPQSNSITSDRVPENSNTILEEPKQDTTESSNTILEEPKHETTESSNTNLKEPKQDTSEINYTNLEEPQPDTAGSTLEEIDPLVSENISQCTKSSVDVGVVPPIDRTATGGHAMTVSTPPSSTYSTDSHSIDMGAAQSHRQVLSKSDSGYSGEDLENDQPPKRKELTVDQALQRYERRVSQSVAPPTFSKVENVKEKVPRARVLSEGTEYSECSDSEIYDASDNEDGVIRRARDTRSFNSRRSSTDSSEDGFNQNVRDLKQELKDLEEKFRKAMVANASLDNEKCQLMFQVDLLKDQVEEGEEQSALVAKELRAKTHDHELLKRDHAESVRSVQMLEGALTDQQAMLQERGLVLLGDPEDEEVEDTEVLDDAEQDKRTRAIVSQETANILAGLGPGPLDVRIKRLAGQREDLQDTVRRLKLDLEEERSTSSLARGAATQEEIERETKKLLDDYKFKISKSEQEIATLVANVARLESQVVRYKTASETAELSEENLKTERRKMQRELRDALTRNEELETQNKHLEKRFDKLKTAKSNLLKEL